MPEAAESRDEARIAGHRLEILTIEAGEPGRTTLVLLHEGLGSIALWRGFPRALAERTGCGVLAYSRYGHGASDRLAQPRGVRYMHDEALEALPALLRHCGIADPVLIGHSDGASIAIIAAGSGRCACRGLVLMAPHVFVEDVTVASIAAMGEAYATTDLPARLGRYHTHVDAMFRGWNDIWLDPDFRSWNIEEYLPAIACPILAIQGADDAYGSLAQLDAVERGAGWGRIERLDLADCGHSPHGDRPEATLDAIACFVASI